MNTPAAASLCPLCGALNQCAMEEERETGVKQEEPCWCVAMSFDEDLLARLPPEKRNLACICAVCAKTS